VHSRFAASLFALFGGIAICASAFAQPVPPPSQVLPPVIIPPSGEHRMVIPKWSPQSSRTNSTRRHRAKPRRTDPAS
jgi:hypothetical protein